MEVLDLFLLSLLFIGVLDKFAPKEVVPTVQFDGSDALTGLVCDVVELLVKLFIVEVELSQHVHDDFVNLKADEQEGDGKHEAHAGLHGKAESGVAKYDWPLHQVCRFPGEA